MIRTADDVEGCPGTEACDHRPQEAEISEGIPVALQEEERMADVPEVVSPFHRRAPGGVEGKAEEDETLHGERRLGSGGGRHPAAKRLAAGEEGKVGHGTPGDLHGLPDRWHRNGGAVGPAAPLPQVGKLPAPGGDRLFGQGPGQARHEGVAHAGPCPVSQDQERFRLGRHRKQPTLHLPRHRRSSHHSSDPSRSSRTEHAVVQPAPIRHSRLGGANRILEVETLVPLSLDEVFPFFAQAENLQRITPPELQFHIETALPVKMALGTVLDYRLRLAGVPFRWRSRITVWDPPHRFLDEQLRGPYREWIHLHTFEETPEGTRVTDRVRYRLPLHPLSLPAAPLVRRQLHRIFTYRETAVRELLCGETDPGARAGVTP